MPGWFRARRKESAAIFIANGTGVAPLLSRTRRWRAVPAKHKPAVASPASASYASCGLPPVRIPEAGRFFDGRGDPPPPRPRQGCFLSLPPERPSLPPEGRFVL